VRQKIARGEKFLEEFVRKNLIDNPHRCTTTFEPVAGLSKEMEDQERKELDTRLQKLSRRDRTELVADTWERIRLKDSKDSPEALTCIPILGISDLDPRNRPVLREERTIGGISCVFHPISSRGIAYLDLCFDFSSLPPELLPAYGVLQGAWSELGSTRRSYDELENVIGTNTGGVKARHLVLPVLGSPSVRTLLSLHGSALVTKLGALREVLSEVLLEVNLSNRARLSDIAGVWKAGAEKSIAGRGHELVAATLRAHYSRSEQVDQLISGGPKRLHRLRQLVTDIDSNWEKVEDQLRKVHRSIVNRNALQLHVACDSGDFDRVAHEIEKLLGVLPTANVGKSSWPLGSPERMVGLAAPCPINYCGMGCDLFSTGYQFHGSARVATALLNNKFLWQEVREKGGAYGVRFGFNNVTGEGLFWSYRDPHIGETLQRFAGSARWLSGTDFSDEDVRKAIISVIAELDTPVHASAEAGSSFSRYLMGVSDEYRQRSRTELLSTTRNDVRAFAAALQQALSKDPTVAVFGDEARLRQSVADGLPYQLKIERVV
jgi:Zn-dependent M16 (insulinase) family peptidase